MAPASPGRGRGVPPEVRQAQLQSCRAQTSADQTSQATTPENGSVLEAPQPPLPATQGNLRAGRHDPAVTRALLWRGRVWPGR
eukprot:366001-Chlamydomonas_euryale.AAC.16